MAQVECVLDDTDCASWINALVVKEGLKKALPDKLYILQTKDEVNYKFEKRARELRRKIEKQFKMSTNKNGLEGMRDDIGAKRRFLILKRSTKL